MRWLTVIGTARPWSPARKRTSQKIGTTLALHGFGLVGGNFSGVDSWVANAFCASLAKRGLSASGRYLQVGVPRWRTPGGWWPGPGFTPREGAQIIDVPEYWTWTDEVIAHSDGAILIGGRRTSLDIARSFLEAGKPVFPIPFTGGYSDAVFREILRTWSEQPVPGLSKAQFTRLAWPWLSGTGPLLELLRAVFDERPSIFVSYRRAD